MKTDIRKAKARLQQLQQDQKRKAAARIIYRIDKDTEKVTGRILPGMECNDGDPFIEAGYHFNVVTGRALLCPARTYGEKCPICEFVELLYKRKGDGDFEMARDIKMKERMMANALIDIGDDKSGYETVFKVFAFSPTVHYQFLEHLDDIDYTDVEKGRNFKITKKMKAEKGKNFFDYMVKIAPTDSAVANWEDVKTKMLDLKELVRRDYLPYETLKQIFETGEMPADAPKGSEDAEEPATPRTVSNIVKSDPPPAAKQTAPATPKKDEFGDEVGAATPAAGAPEGGGEKLSPLQKKLAELKSRQSK